MLKPGELEGAALDDVLGAALSEMGDANRIACSFSIEDIVVLDAAVRVGALVGVTPRPFLLDTGRLHQTTYEFIDGIRSRFHVSVDVFAPDPNELEPMLRKRGMNSFYESVSARKECCGIRKVGPLSRALAGATGWITGLRRAQSETRGDVAVVELDRANGGLLKVSPLAAWSESDVWTYSRDRGLPIHPLHKEGFASIGCAPCTRAIAPGEPVRSGRWWWESDEHKECGIHSRGRP